MNKLKIGVVEDEFIIADTICNTLTGLGYEVAEPVASYSEALEMIEREKPDLLLLDIQLSGAKDGIDLAWKVKEDHDIPFIFLTANADAATIEKAKRVSPPAYLVKPFVKEDLYAAIEICIHNYSLQKTERNKDKKPDFILSDSLFIKENNTYIKIPYRDILYLESDHVYVRIHVADKRSYLVRASMQDYLKHFDPSKFIRVHRSYVINVEKIDTINDRTVTVKGIDVPITKIFRQELLNKLILG